MSIQSEIIRLQGVKADILSSIEAKDVIVPTGAMLADCPGLIASITTGGGGVPYLKNIIPTIGVKVVDERGYIGGDFFGVYYPNDNYYNNNLAIVIPDTDYSGSEFGTVTFINSGSTTIGGRVYRTVTIGGHTWLAENLDFKFSGCNIGGSGSPTTPNAWYYRNDEATYGWKGSKYGLLYNWYAVNLLNINRHTLIPGWHVPSTAEWDELANAVGGASTAGTVLKSTIYWSTGAGTDVYGFTGLPAGRYFDGSFDFSGIRCYFWTSDVESQSNSTAYRRYLDKDTSMISDFNQMNNGYSLRLVKD